MTDIKKVIVVAWILLLISVIVVVALGMAGIIPAETMDKLYDVASSIEVLTMATMLPLILGCLLWNYSR